MALYLLSSPEGARCNYFERILKAGVIKLVSGWRARCNYFRRILLGAALYVISSPEGARCNYFRRILRAGVIKLVSGWPCIYSPAPRAPGVIILKGY